jgi:phosphate transport system protein
MTAQQHTSRRYEEELAELQRRLVAMGARSIELIEMATRALRDRNTDLAHDVEEADRGIDKDEMEIDDLTVRILALRQPAARDLRFLVFALKVVTDLERIGDESSNMAERAIQLASHQYPATDLVPKITDMAELTKELVRQALDAFVKGDEQLARGVRSRDDEVDAMYGEVLRGCLEYIKQNPEHVSAAMCLASTSKYLERIADHATNIAELVVFVTSGEDVRHPFKR